MPYICSLDNTILVAQWCRLCHCVCSSLFVSTLDWQIRWLQTDKQIKLFPFLYLSRFLYVSVCECSPLPEPEPQMYGKVQSPLYPQPYPPNLQEQWDLVVPEGYQIRLTFTHLDIEASANCYYDSLTVRPIFQYIYRITLKIIILINSLRWKPKYDSRVTLDNLIWVYHLHMFSCFCQGN